jgi:membrane associated rhomboid family serine protease
VIPLSDENPTLRTPIVTYVLVGLNALVWVFVQGAGLDPTTLAASVCNLGLVAGELTGMAATGTGVQIAAGMQCLVDNDPINYITPVTSMFLHGSWAHIIGNMLFLWVFGNNVEDSMGRLRFVVFYVGAGLLAALAQVVVEPGSAVPMVGASGAIAGVMGGYLVLYPRVRVNMLFIFIIFFKVIPLPAWAVLIWWGAVQVLTALPALMNGGASSGGVAVMAHIGGFVAGMLLIKLFEDKELYAQHAYGHFRDTRHRRP